MSTNETVLGILLTVSVLVNVWIIAGGRVIMRRLERQIRKLQGDLLTALHTGRLWREEARRLSGQIPPPNPNRKRLP